MVKAYGKVPAWATLLLLPGLAGCGGEEVFPGGEGKGLAEAAEAGPSVEPSSPESPPVREPGEPVSVPAEKVPASSVEDTLPDVEGTAPSPDPEPAVAEPAVAEPGVAEPPPPGRTLPPRPRIERRAPVLEPPPGPRPAPLQEVELPPEGITVPAGTQVMLRAETRLSSRHAWAGDRFRARVVDDVLDPDGMVLIPLDALVEGVVTRVVRGEGRDGEPGLELEPGVLIVQGRVHDLDARVVNVDLETRTVTDGPEMAKKAVAGAAAGAILGKILGKDGKSTIAGAVAGAAAGAAVGAAGGEKEAVLEEGALLEIVLSADLRLEEDPEEIR